MFITNRTEEFTYVIGQPNFVEAYLVIHNNDADKDGIRHTQIKSEKILINMSFVSQIDQLELAEKYHYRKDERGVLTFVKSTGVVKCFRIHFAKGANQSGWLTVIFAKKKQPKSSNDHVLKSMSNDRKAR